MNSDMHRAMIQPGPQAIEEWAKLVIGAPKRELTLRESEAFIEYCIAENDLENKPEIIKGLEDGTYGYASVIWKRVKYCHSYTISVALCAFLGDIVARNFGICTMVVNYMQYLAYRCNKKSLNMQFFGMKVFPTGLPTDNAWQQLWDAQKVNDEQMEAEDYRFSDNILDRPEFMQSIKMIGE